MKRFLTIAALILLAPVSLPFLSGMWVTGCFDTDE